MAILIAETKEYQVKVDDKLFFVRRDMEYYPSKYQKDTIYNHFGIKIIEQEIIKPIIDILEKELKDDTK